MKWLYHIAASILIMTAQACFAQITTPGWFHTETKDQTVKPRATFAAQKASFDKSATHFQPLSLFVEPSTPIAEEVTPQIQSLAKGLLYDPNLIFYYVRDKIRFVLYFGSKKGAQLTYLEKSGNDFDQCALLVALLRASGYTNVAYKFGWMQIPYDNPLGNSYDLHHWWQLTLNNTDWTNTVSYLGHLLSNRGYPLEYYVNDGNSFLVQRTWVALTVNGETYNLDPAFKVNFLENGISMTNAISSTSISNTLMSAAAGADTASYTSNLNEVAIRSTLTGYTTNFLNFIQNNAANAGVEQILTNWIILPASIADISTNVTFPIDDFSGQMPVLTWQNQPTNLMSTFAINVAGSNYQRFIPQLQGQRLTLTFGTNGLSQLWQEDTLLMQQTNSGSLRTTNIVISFNHPYGAWDTTNNLFIDGTLGDQIVTNTYQRTNATYVLSYAFEPDWDWLRQRQTQLDAYLQQGFTNGSRQVVSETLNILGLTWLLETANTENMLASQLGILPQYAHRFGRVAQEAANGYYIDFYMQLTGEYPNNGDSLPTSNTHFDLTLLFSSALEHGVLEQMQSSNLTAASTVKMLEIANTNGQQVFLANSTNWTTGANIRGQLTNYDSGTLDGISSNFINQGYNVLLSKSGSNHVSSATGSWAGYGYEARITTNGQTGNSYMIIGGGYHGGFIQNATLSLDSSYTDTHAQSQPTMFQTPDWLVYTPSGADPVDLADGVFQVEAADLSLGTAEPRGISFGHYYSGTRRFANSASMTYGWLHNYYGVVNAVAAPQAALGKTTPAQAAPMLSATAAAIAVYNSQLPNAKNWLVTQLITKWGVDQIARNGVSVALGKDTIQFVKQPNGVFTPPAGCTMTLVQTNSGYNLVQRHGNTLKFDSVGRLTNIVDQYNQSLKLAYNVGGQLSTITDWKSRTITLAYSGTPSRMVSATDSTGRSVKYNYVTNSGQIDLGSIVDPEGKTNTYLYSTNHQISAVKDGLNQVVVSNMYDDFGHITTQYTAGDTNRIWQIGWSGIFALTVDPLGGVGWYWFDEKGRLVHFLDHYANETDNFYDGQDHVYYSMSPLHEVNQYVFDGNQNLAQTIDPLGFADLFVYDSQNNLIQHIDELSHTNSYGYNSKFQLTAQTNGAGGWTTNGYSSTDGSLTARGDQGGVTTYAYDANGYLNGITYPGSLGREGFLNNTVGDITSHTNGRGFVTSFQYNLRRQITNTISPTNLLSKLFFDTAGNVAATIDPRGFATSNTWSATHMLLKTTFPATAQGVPVISNTYDQRDWLSKTYNPLQQSTTYTNDAVQRLISTTDPLSRTLRFGYDADGHRTFTTNAALEVTAQRWDARGELVQTVDPLNNSIVHVYSAVGVQSALTNRNGKQWLFQYDAANRLTNTITPLGRQTRLSYDNRNLLSIVREPSGQALTNFYDPKGRLTNAIDQAASRTFGYDSNNNLQTITENSKTNIWTYDAYDRLSGYKDADGNSIQYRYDQSGNITNLIYPGSRVVRYVYDALNRLTNIVDWAGRSTLLEYDLAGHTTKITRPNNTVREMKYDSAGEITNIVERTVSGTGIAFCKMSWNAAARADWEFIAPLPHTNALPSRSMTYNDDNQLAYLNGSAVSYDDDGNMTNGPSVGAAFTDYSFNARNQLVAMGGVTNIYDPAGYRTTVTASSGSTKYVVNPNAKLSQVLMRIRSGVTNYYIYGGGLLYEVTETAANTNVLTYHFDYRGSTVALSDTNGNVTDRIEYSAYATTTYRAGTNDTPFLFNGRYGVITDPNGLLYMRSRFYNPYICRFISADPSGFGGGLNFYAYADGNPVSDLDPFGLDASTINSVPPVSLALSPNVFPAQTAFQAAGSLPFVPDHPYYNPNFSTTMTIGGQAYAPDFLGDAQRLGIALSPYVFAGAAIIAPELALDLSPELELAAPEIAASDSTTFIYRTGSQTDGALTDVSGVSFRDSVSSSADGKQIFNGGQNIYAVDTRLLPENSVVLDGQPAGHVSIFATPEEIRAAIVPQGPENPLFDFGMKAMDNGSSYKLPK